MKVLSKEYVSPAHVLNQLSGRDELKRRQQSTLEHLKKHLVVDDEGTVEELVGELEDMDTFNDAQVLKIIEVLPMSEREVRALFSKERIKLDDSDIQAVIDFSESVRE